MQNSEMFVDQHRKRFREEEDDISSASPVGFTEHRSKRLHSLPLRTSPNLRRWTDRPSSPLPDPSFVMTDQIQVIRPEETIQEQHTWADEPELTSANPPSAMVIDSDMDMTDTSELVSARGEPDRLGSFRADEAVLSITGRIPTPIHCSFASQVRGSSWNGGNAAHGDALATTPEEPNAAAFNMNRLVDISQQSGAAATAQVMADWRMVQNRRLPSPISECGAEESQGRAIMAVDSGSLTGGGPLSQLTHEHPLLAGLLPRANSAMGGRSAREDTLASECQNGNAMDVELPATPSPRKGHTRSKHTLNSWTSLQPGMKRSFSIGYRADCEKCRMKVPGHFNHIIIS